MKPKLIFILVYLSSIHFILASVTGEQNNSNEALKYLQLKPDVKISLHQRDIYVTSPLDVYVKISNLTESNFSISDVEFDFPEMQLGRGTDEKTSSEIELVSKQLDSGNSLIKHHHFPKASSKLLSPFNYFQLLFFKPAEYDLRVVITFQSLGRNKTMIEEIVKVKLEPPLSSIIWGGILGSVLLALFLTSFDKFRERQKVKFISRFLVISFSGAISAIIFLILMFRLKDVQLPIIITVVDFYGGVVVGLFTYKIGDWLHTKLADETNDVPVNEPHLPGS